MEEIKDTIQEITIKVDHSIPRALGYKYFTMNRSGRLCYHKKEPVLGANRDYWHSPGMNKTCGRVQDIEHYCFKVSDTTPESPVWLTPSLGSRLLEQGYNYLACDFNGYWRAYKEIPCLAEDEDRWTTDDVNSTLCIFNDLGDNPKWRLTLIELKTESEAESGDSSYKFKRM